MSWVFTEPRSYCLFRVPNLANPSLFIFSLANAAFSLRHCRPPSRLCPPLPSIADCVSDHEANVTGIASPPNSTRKATILRHRHALRRTTSPRSTITTTWRQTLSLLRATAPVSLLRLLHHYQPLSHR